MTDLMPEPSSPRLNLHYPLERPPRPVPSATSSQTDSTHEVESATRTTEGEIDSDDGSNADQKT